MCYEIIFTNTLQCYPGIKREEGVAVENCYASIRFVFI